MKTHMKLLCDIARREIPRSPPARPSQTCHQKCHFLPEAFVRSIPDQRAAPSTGRRRCQTGLPGCSSRRRCGGGDAATLLAALPRAARRGPAEGEARSPLEGPARAARVQARRRRPRAYLALRRRDLRDLQDQLTLLGLSSLGRLEARVLANLDAVIAALAPRAGVERAGPHCPRLLARRAAARAQRRRAAGRRAPRRRAIMVTIGQRGGRGAALVERPGAPRHGRRPHQRRARRCRGLWARMVANLRRAGRRLRARPAHPVRSRRAVAAHRRGRGPAAAAVCGRATGCC